MAETNEKTNAQFEQVMQECRSLFEKKLHDYGASWRILRPQSLTDQLFIKAKRIRSLEIKKESLVGEGIRPEFIALINYGIVGLIQLAHGFSDTVDMRPQEAMALYDRYALEALELMKRKNHDYDEAWRGIHQDRTYQGDRKSPGRHPRQRGHRRQLHGHHQLCGLRGHQVE